MNEQMAHEPLDVEQKTRLTLSQHLAFKASCLELGIKQADVQRALILQFIQNHHARTALQTLGLQSTPRLDTE